jgi:hypothetical protein
MPIVAPKLSDGSYAPVYVEREISEPVDLCDPRGRLDPRAVGWSRSPMVRANLSGHWPRKKRWNFWNWIGPDFVLQATLADIDYAAFCSVSFIDFETREHLGHTALRPPRSFAMPEHVDRTVTFRGGGIEYRNENEGGDATVHLRSPTGAGPEIAADFSVRRPVGHESLNVVVPWSATRFQLNSKHNTLPCEGELRIGGRRYALDPETCHAVQDFGRGLWPYHSFWNWGVCTGTQGGRRIGVNMGAKWTTGTGANENGILLDGRLHKVMEDLRWSYDPGDWMKPWSVHSEHSDAIDLILQPRVEHRSRTSLGLVSTGGVCCFGSWTGRVRVEEETFEIDGLPGWAEEFEHRW